MGQVNLLCSVVTNGGDLYIRNGPSLANTIIGWNPNGASNLHATEEQNGWYYLVDYSGWSSGDWLSIDKNLETETTVDVPELEQVEVPPQMTLQEQIRAYKDYVAPDTVQDVSNLLTTSLEGIYGIPYQFMGSVDQKMDGTQFGGIYADKIIARMPLLLLAPGKVNFMRDFMSGEDRSNFIQELIDRGGDATEFNDIIENKGGRYYSFEFDYAQYYNYVDAMCMTGSYFLGIEDAMIKVGGKNTKIRDVDWSTAGTNCFKKVLSTAEYVAFYVDSASQVSEDFNNNTTESQLASKINSFSDIGRELNFILGVTTGKQFIKDSQSQIDEAMNTITSISKDYLGGNKLFEDIGKNFATVAIGGKLIFPEIWADSDYSKSYDINIKLRTPDGDKLSWFLNIYVPLAHLICLTAPKQASESGPNGYVAPFLVRGFYKGLFNCDMGIITSLSISRGKEKAWTLDGLPTEVDVSVQLKDLYSMMTISSYTSPGAFVNNIVLMDYIANSCGININEPDYMRSAEVYAMLNVHKLTQAIPDLWQTVEQDVANKIMQTQQRITNLLGFLDGVPLI